MILLALSLSIGCRSAVDFPASPDKGDDGGDGGTVVDTGGGTTVDTGAGTGEDPLWSDEEELSTWPWSPRAGCLAGSSSTSPPRGIW